MKKEQRGGSKKSKEEDEERVERKTEEDIAEGGRGVVNKGVEKGWKGWGGGR